jgi:hypothetical protein
VFEAKQRLRDVYPNVLEIELQYMLKTISGEGGERVDHRSLEPKDLFANFYKFVQGEDWSEEHVVRFTSIAYAIGTEDER